MEGSDISRVDSARASGYNIWRNNSMDVFSTSEREDDEEALKWAAIERLPTYLRIRRSILNNEDGKGREVDIKQLGLTERKFLMERLVKIAEEDNERFLLKLRERMDRLESFFLFLFLFFLSAKKENILIMVQDIPSNISLREQVTIKDRSS